MTFNFILLMTAECKQAVMMGLALCIIPAILGWLAAYIYYKVPGLRQRRDELETEVKGLNTTVGKLTEEGTDLRVQLTQADAQLEDRKATISKLRSDLIIVESERNLLRGEPKAEGKGGKSAKAHVEKVTFLGVDYNWDDLKIVEGIGPKIEDLLLNAGIKTWKALAGTSETLLTQMLDEAGPRFQMHNPATWPEQARMADAGDWDALEKYQEELKGGRE
jgi:predicted flap endonuclease-1-like 5' DNA nuclease